MSLSDIVNVQISRGSVAVTRTGFGVPLILTGSVSWAERTRTYDGPTSVAVDFATTTVEYKMANRLFAQTPRPKSIVIGRCTKPTQTYVITVLVVANTTVYKCNVGGNVASYTSDGSATNDEIATGLAAAITALAGDTVSAAATGAGGSKVCTVTSDAAGDWDSVDLDLSQLTNLKIANTTADAGLSADLDAILLENDTWYSIDHPFISSACILAVAAWAETNKKCQFAQTGDSYVITSTSGTDGTSVAYSLKNSAYARTALIWKQKPSDFAPSAWTGGCLPLDPGSETWKFKTLAGVPADALTPSYIANAKAKNCNVYTTVGGVNITYEGVVSDGEFIDVIRGLDWLEATIRENVFATLAGAKKVPFTDDGVAMIEVQVEAALAQGVKQGLLARDPAPLVTVPKVADVSSANKSARKLPDVAFSATLAGAVHAVDPISGTVSA